MSKFLCSQIAKNFSLPQVFNKMLPWQCQTNYLIPIKSECIFTK